MTVYQRRVEYDMVEDPRIIPDDSELRRLVEQTRQELPYLGEVMVMGRLRALGYYVTRSLLRQVINETDPINSALRWGSNLHVRRPFSVPGPNSLWHIGIRGHKNIFMHLLTLQCIVYSVTKWNEPPTSS